MKQGRLGLVLVPKLETLRSIVFVHVCVELAGAVRATAVSAAEPAEPAVVVSALVVGGVTEAVTVAMVMLAVSAFASPPLASCAELGIAGIRRRHLHSPKCWRQTSS
jgi:hypothetical protein